MLLPFSFGGTRDISLNLKTHHTKSGILLLYESLWEQATGQAKFAAFSVVPAFLGGEGGYISLNLKSHTTPKKLLSGLWYTPAGLCLPKLYPKD